MNARLLLANLRERGVEIEADGHLLHVDAPEGIVTEELRASLAECKPQLLRVLEREKHKLKEAGKRGLVIRWSEYPIWISLHDPLTGEWHEIRASECLPSVVETANRKRSRRGEIKDGGAP